MRLAKTTTRVVLAALLASSAAPWSVALAGDGLLTLARSCGKNAFLTADGDCRCKRHHELRNGKCVSVRGHYGANARHSDQPGCWTWLKMCRENDVAACQFYEGSCT
jgi:hypothetical protein